MHTVLDRVRQKYPVYTFASSPGTPVKIMLDILKGNCRKQGYVEARPSDCTGT